MSMKDWLRDTRTTQGEVAHATGRSREFVNRVANGREQPTPGFVMDFFFAFGTEATIAAFDMQEQAA